MSMIRFFQFLVAALLALPVAASAQTSVPSDWTEGYALANGIRIHYWRSGGDKPPLVMTHGYSDDGLCWTRIALELTDHYDVILPDARGHGRSDPPSRNEPADVQVEDLAGFIDALKLNKPIIVGHSMGSASAAWFAARYPAVPGAVVLVDPRLVNRTPQDLAKMDKAYYQRRAASIFQKNNQSYQELFNGQMERNPHWGITELHFWALSKQMHHPNAAYSNLAGRPSMSDSFARITCPTLILKADDKGALREDNKRIAAILAKGQLVHVEGAGHSVHRDQRQRFMEALNGFLDRIGR